jgi:hypothetical protein
LIEGAELLKLLKFMVVSHDPLKSLFSKGIIAFCALSLRNLVIVESTLNERFSCEKPGIRRILIKIAIRITLLIENGY